MCLHSLEERLSKDRNLRCVCTRAALSQHQVVRDTREERGLKEGIEGSVRGGTARGLARPRQSKWDYLPVNGEAVDEDWMAFLGRSLAEALEQDEDTRRLLVVETRVVAHDDVVQQNVDVGHLVRMKRGHQGVRVGDEIPLCRD